MSERYSSQLQCPYCEQAFLVTNQLGIATPSEACRHLVVFDPVFSTRFRTPDGEFQVVDDATTDTMIDLLPCESVLVHDSRPAEHLADQGWTAVYNQSPTHASALLAEEYGTLDAPSG